MQRAAQDAWDAARPAWLEHTTSSPNDSEANPLYLRTSHFLNAATPSTLMNDVETVVKRMAGQVNRLALQLALGAVIEDDQRRPTHLSVPRSFSSKTCEGMSKGRLVQELLHDLWEASANLADKPSVYVISGGKTIEGFMGQTFVDRGSRYERGPQPIRRTLLSPCSDHQQIHAALDYAYGSLRHPHATATAPFSAPFVAPGRPNSFEGLHACPTCSHQPPDSTAPLVLWPEDEILIFHGTTEAPLRLVLHPGENPEQKPAFWFRQQDETTPQVPHDFSKPPYTQAQACQLGVAFQLVLNPAVTRIEHIKLT